ncbi:MAG TPA: hypothetical protein DHV17_02580, partial [Chitinophagaceae bacterium]|nr:hypothetical protein [Chitinophagaceae bacterium]
MVGFSAHAQVSPFNLLVNGDFEGGGSGNGFQVQAPYNFIGTPPPLTGNSAPGDYAIIPNPQPMNLANFIPGTDHSGTGKMMVVDGTTVGGGQRFWKAGSTGGGVGPLTIGLTYTFSYWKKSVSITAVDAGTSANISVAWNNAASVTLVSGSEQVSFPGTTSVWEKITYSFVPTNAWVNIELYNNNTNPVGNDFAIDDVEVLPPPTPLGIRYSFVQPACPGGNDGSVTAYGTGGTLPYAYNLNGGTFTGNNMFTGLPGGASYEIRTRDNENNIAISNPAIVLTEPVNPLTVRNDTTICQGNSINLQATATGSGSFSWTANPPDPSLLNPNIANPVVSQATPTTYTVNYSYTFARDLIYNGNFELGDLGFATEYSFIANNATGAQRAYSVTNNPNTFEPGFSNLCVDHSTGTGKMMVVDGSTNPNTVVWKQKVPVQPNTNYTFRYWLQTVAMPSSVASIETLINGQPITGSSLTSTLSAGALCNWAQFTANWNAGTSTEAEITLINRNTAASGNDFALDDISFTSSQTCIVSKSVFVDVV